MAERTLHRRFILAALRHLAGGGPVFYGWMALCAVVAGSGVVAYLRQLDHGLQVTGMSDQVAWGLYIGNFTFLVGIAAAAVVLVVPAHVFRIPEMRPVVLLGESMAVSAVAMSLLFVFVDLGQPLRVWHALPGPGSLNFPASILAWDMVVLVFYLVLNLGLGYAFLHARAERRRLDPRITVPLVVLAVVGGIAIHTVTAFMLAGNPARPFWHTAALAPRFIASAFAAGSAFLIVLFQVLGHMARFEVARGAVRLLALVFMFALLLNLFLLGSELFVHFYGPHGRANAAQYLYAGLPGADRLTPWIRAATLAEGLAAVILVVHRLRLDFRFLNAACLLAIPAIWIEKGLGLVVPGFVPTPLGEVVEYGPTGVEILVSAGIWAFGAMLFTALARITVAVETGRLRHNSPH